MNETFLNGLLWPFLATSLYAYPGCTDPFALNFDDGATIDNGTCVYSIGPDLSNLS